jgi:hypothetical protein
MKVSSAIVLAGAAHTFAAVRPRPMVSSGPIQAEIKTEKYGRLSDNFGRVLILPG